ncbi:dTDP-4-dehydrorhamnose reductase [Gillisia mitskevichiae]|uniref:dTDP-4-dehydrorhamnose reductase n=1 Tax=Gillisia mitskevichiae TaxID=270921 RepID=A0A495PZ64_9FLAO|nr:dTDP-4-dehydrorhamnose reductase [Gillisia mitskevichiae]RKS55410.1 dTDP-4-dehydrorhamnose reductase [Gillisia mitskevichiae]
MKTVLVTGASGQLGKCIQKIAANDHTIDWLFMDSSEIDITSKSDLKMCFNSKEINYCINCAAYTNVEKAESDKDKAYKINAEAVKSLAEICKKHSTVLLHISTDYVFDGRNNIPYKETDKTNPINVYGASKLKGEQNIQNTIGYYFIFRTSWLYSEFGHNFYKTILNKAAEKTTLNITTAQKGTPTNANDLAELLVKIIKEENKNYGLYHYSNSGETTWHGFAKEILRVSNKSNEVILNEDNSYKTIAERPLYSVLDKTKFKTNFELEVDSWQDAVLDLYNNNL